MTTNCLACAGPLPRSARRVVVQRGHALLPRQRHQLQGRPAVAFAAERKLRCGELLELHTIGDTEAYTLRDIHEAARALTGWSIGGERGGAEGEFVFHAADHDEDAKIVMGGTLPACPGLRDGELLLDRLARYLLTVRFVTGKLCRHFLGYVPEELHGRLAEVWRSDGDIRSLVVELIDSDEFRHGERPRFKRPMHFVVSAIRVLGVRTSGAAMVPYLEAMGHRPFAWRSPTVTPARPEPWVGGLLCAELRHRPAAQSDRPDLDQSRSVATRQRNHQPTEVCRQLSESLLGAAPGRRRIGRRGRFARRAARRAGPDAGAARHVAPFPMVLNRRLMANQSPTPTARKKPDERLVFRPETGPAGDVLVTVFLRGGMDAVYAIPPYADPAFHLRRNASGFVEPGRDGFIALDDFFGLHRDFAELEPLYRRKQLAIIQGVGLSEPLLSHFDATLRARARRCGRRVGRRLAGRHLALRCRRAIPRCCDRSP